MSIDDIFALNLDELLENAELATDLIKVEKDIRDYFNSNEAIIENYLEIGKNYNNLNELI